MNDLNLYEKIPQDICPVRIHFVNKIRPTSFYLHWHEHMEIHYVIEGTSIIKCNRETTEVNEGDCIVINSNELHEGAGGMGCYFCVILPPSFLPRNNIIFNRIIKDTEVANIMKSIMEEYLCGDEIKDISMQGHAMLLLSHLYRKHIFKEFSKAEHNSYSQKTIMLNETIKYIHDNYMNELSLDILAKRLYITPEHLCRSFKEATQKTVIEYINEVRIKKAKELLSTTDLPITEIAYLCGFNDSNYFSRKFKEITKMTPRMMRKS